MGSKAHQDHKRSARALIRACLDPNRVSHHSASLAVMSVTRISTNKCLSLLLGANRTKRRDELGAMGVKLSLIRTERRKLNFTAHLLFTPRLGMISAGDAASRGEGSVDARNADLGLPSEGNSWPFAGPPSRIVSK